MISVTGGEHIIHLVPVIFLLAFLVTQGHGSELEVNQTADSEEHPEKLVDELAKNLVDRGFEIWSLKSTDLDNTALAKPGNIQGALPPSITLSLSSPTGSLRLGDSYRALLQKVPSQLRPMQPRLWTSLRSSRLSRALQLRPGEIQDSRGAPPYPQPESLGLSGTAEAAARAALVAADLEKTSLPLHSAAQPDSLALSGTAASRAALVEADFETSLPSPSPVATDLEKTFLSPSSQAMPVKNVAAEDAAEAAAQRSKFTLQMPLRLLQFNILAPSARICQPLNRVAWQSRHVKICDMILHLEPDIICLQEFDFSPDTRGFESLYREKLGSLFSLHLKKRTGTKLDGLALLLRKDVFENVDVSMVDLMPDFCNRVAIVARAQHRTTGRRIIVCNTHLTVPHATNSYDIPINRPVQMQQVLQLIGGADPADIVYLCADMNSDHLEQDSPKGDMYSPADVHLPVTMAFDQGLQSALHTAHPGIRPMSHTCSYAQDGCVDYIFFRPSNDVKLKTALLLPQDIPLDREWNGNSGWAEDLNITMSDHRPVLADFYVAASEQKLLGAIRKGKVQGNGKLQEDDEPAEFFAMTSIQDISLPALAVSLLFVGSGVTCAMLCFRCVLPTRGEEPLLNV